VVSTAGTGDVQIKTVERARDIADAHDPAPSIPSDACPALQGIGGTSAAISSREVFARSFTSRQRCPHSS